MSEKHSQGNGQRKSSVSRRTFVKAAGVSGATVSLAGCIYGDGAEASADAVTLGLDPNMVSEVGDEFVDLLHENGADGIEIELQSGAEDTGERRDTYTQLLQAEETEPDLLLMDNGWVNVFIQRGDIENLSDHLDDDALSRVEDDYFEAFTATAREPETDDLYGIPIFPDYPTMQYRKDYAREAGYDEDDFEEWATEPMTWQEWAEVTEEIVEASDADYGLATQWDIYEGTACCTWNEVMSSFGGAYFGGFDNLFGPVGDRPVTVDEPEFVEGLEMMRTFVADEHDDYTNDDYPLGLATSDITSWMEEDAREAILNGSAVMQRNWPYAINQNVGDDEDLLDVDDYGAMPIPYGVSEDEAAQPGTGGTTAALGGWHMTLNPHSERKEEATQVLQAMMEDSFNLDMFELWGWVPPKPDLFDAEEAEAIDPMGEYMDTLRVAGENAMPRPVTTVWPDQATLIAEEVNNAVAGDKAPDEAAADLQGGLEDIEG
ncbi:substrate-binding domain-containing protein [Natronobacterium texcoconense]|uniref:ABC-type glycerol-3-phosphate transport system, substrate-binding protein n=1 Tax=Natronobacterium texcoconense TaxID=1095778 RepID=A0A1H1GMX2_NATTX|nr:substrate-binding domain-containing protein [Natronobacterium texcoconense]SDR14433.1 ABC-type glycerol-3-phosphate transport system, substrate-binding protein [Natronobacterium texcoconense]